MSSATSTRDARGQVLVLFALALVTLMMAAALAFDGGMVLLEQRDQQNAADAAVIAGARFLPDEPSTARSRAAAIATTNGFTDGTDSVDIDISVGSWSPAGGFIAGGSGGSAIEMVITNTRPAIFAGVIGRSGWDVTSRAVAVNQDASDGPFALLSLDPHACPGMRIEGTGVVSSAGNIQVNSDCDTGDKAFRVAGTGALELQAEDIGCNIVGGSSIAGGAVVDPACDPPSTGAPSIPDPYGSLPDPPNPAVLPCDNVTTPCAPAMVRWDPLTDLPHADGTPPPDGCPGSANPATSAAPLLCAFEGNQAGRTWRIFAGYYPGGLDLRGDDASYLLEPGVYYIGGGGFRVANAGLTSVDPGGMTLGGGVLIFNSDHPSGTPLPKQIVLQGGSAPVNLWPLVGTGVYADYDRFVLYQDRDLPTPPTLLCDTSDGGSALCDVRIVGGASDMDVRGIVYAPSSHVSARGSTGTLTIDQVIADTFEIRGNGGTINVANDTDFLPTLEFAGLVE